MMHALRRVGLVSILTVVGLSCQKERSHSEGGGDKERPAGATDQGFRGDIQALTLQNTDFRRVLFTGRNIQLVAMSLPAKEDIGEEVHDVDQCFFFVVGTAETTVAGEVSTIGKNGLVCVPAGTRHNIRNAGNEDLKLFTTYSPPQHPAGTVHRTKADATRT